MSSSDLRIKNISPSSDGRVKLEFDALSNKTYAVEFRDEAQAGNWGRLVEFLATGTNQVVELSDEKPTQSGRRRFCRLVTPRLP